MIEGFTVFEGPYGCAYLEVFQKHWIAAAKGVQQSVEREMQQPQLLMSSFATYLSARTASHRFTDARKQRGLS